MTTTTTPASQIGRILVEMNENSRDYCDHITGALNIALAMADLRLDREGIAAWFLDHDKEISQAIHDELVSCGIISEGDKS